MPIGERCVHDRHGGRAVPVGLGEGTSREDRLPHRLEIAGRHGPELDGVFHGVRSRPGLARDRVPERHLISDDRRLRRPGHRLDAGQGPKPFGQWIEEGPLLLSRRIGRGRQPDRDGREPLGLEAEIDRVELDHRTNEEPGSDEEPGGERHLAHEDGRAQPRLGPAAAFPPPPFREDGGRIDTGRAQGREEPEEDRRGDRRRQGEAQDRRIGAGRREERDVGGRQGDEEAGERDGEGDPERAAHRRQDRALDERRANQTPAARPERAPDGELAPARREAGQHQVGQIGAGDEQHHAHDGQQDPHERADGTGQVGPEGHDVGSPARHALGVRGLEPGGDRVELRVGPLGRDAGRQAADGAPLVGAAVRALARRGEPETRPGLHVVIREAEARSHHPHDLVRLIVQSDTASEDALVAAEPRAPETPAEHDGAGGSRTPLLGREEPSERRPRPEDAEGGRRHRDGLDLLRGRAGLRQDEGQLEPVGAERLEARGLVPPIDVGSARDVVAGVLGLLGLHHLHDTVRIGVRKRPEEDGIGDAEDPGRGPDGERKGRDGHEGERRRASQAPNGPNEVAPELAGPGAEPGPPLTAAGLRHQDLAGRPYIAELPLCPRARRLAVQAARHQLLRPRIEVEADLGLDILAGLAVHRAWNAEDPAPAGAHRAVSAVASSTSSSAST